MTRRSHKIAVAVLFVLVLIAAVVVLSRSAFAQESAVSPGPEFGDCLTDAKTLLAAEHYAQYCGRCHLAEKLATNAQKTGDRDQAKSDMMAFLSHHGSCPAEIDQEIADYLVNLGTAR